MLEKIVFVEDFGMGGLKGRVYWFEGMEEWLKLWKREINKKVFVLVILVKKKKGGIKEEDDEVEGED